MLTSQAKNLLGRQPSYYYRLTKGGLTESKRKLAAHHLDSEAWMVVL